jgi:transitional endoplasmic reticulum ATPase
METMETINVIPAADECVTLLSEFSGLKLDPETAGDLWEKIIEHKWVLSERLGRDVGLRVACVDYVENITGLHERFFAEDNVRLLRELGARMIDRGIWDTISDSQPPKQIVNRRIVLPLREVELARKHGVIPTKTIIFFGPPGTGKTHFVRAIAGALGWWYIEVSPSDLMADGTDRMGTNLKRLMERVRDLENAVLFIDEFEEIAGSRDQASRLDKSITNEFLKQVPLLKRGGNNVVLVCATNYIRDLDAALLRPGRFDCIIPVGGLDAESRRTIFEHYLGETNHGNVDVDRIVSEIPMFTPADIEYLFQRVTQAAFESEYAQGLDHRLSTQSFLDVIRNMRPTLTPEIIEEFQEDCREYSRY